METLQAYHHHDLVKILPRSSQAYGSSFWPICFLWQDINEMVRTERPDWQNVMLYVTAIYKYFETWNPNNSTDSWSRTDISYQMEILLKC